MQNTILDKYTAKVENLVQTLPSIEERYDEIIKINEEFFDEVGENLPAHLIEMLGTWYLKETYSDNRSNKVALEEYPVLTEHQLYRRGRKNVLIEEEAVLDTIKYHRVNNSSKSVDKSKNLISERK